MATITLNGRKQFFRRVTSIKLDGTAYHVETSHGAYTIEGGKRAGGSARDWFVSGAHINHSIACTSVMDALLILDNM